MKWLLILVLFGGCALFIMLFYDKYKFFKKEGYWYQDYSGKYGALIYAFLFLVSGVIILIHVMKEVLS